MAYQIVLVDKSGNADAYAAGDPTPGRGANEFETREAAEAAIPTLGEPGEGACWEARERR